ncbi:HNH endonuclease signature motif containing protein [Janibacter limosus]|uniref:HNH endonuclease signature motif containing protein n=1 Tax=Janibacter limosus TaxID=53458 RepID=UPI00146FFD67|nr:HNH endonuclease signature motif containing protein [Janibacter limosus]
MDDAELESTLSATEAARRAVDAMELTLVAELNRHGERRGSDGLYRDVRLAVDQVAEMAPDALALAIGVAPAEADRRCRLAARSATDLADLTDLLAQGRVSRRALEMVHRHTRDTTAETTRALVDHLLGAKRGQPESIRITEMEPHEIAKACRRLLTRLDPDLMQARADANRATRLDVRTEPGPVGTSYLTATLPSEICAAIKAAVDAAGGLRLEEDPSMPIGTARALGLADLVLRGVDVEAQVRLGIPVIASAVSRLTFAPVPSRCGGCRGRSAGPRDMTDAEVRELLADDVEYERATTETVRIVTGSGADEVEVLSEEWMADVSTQVRVGATDDAPWVSGTTIPGVGFVPPDVVAALVARLDTKVARALIDARTGTLLETSTPRYAIPKAQREFVAARDATCRMWGCERPVHSTRLGWAADVDHATPWPEGETTPGNLSALCRHHHRVKHSPRWTHRLDADGSTEWITPGGVHAFTFPVHAVDADDEDEEGASSPSTGTNEGPGAGEGPEGGTTTAASSPSTGTRPPATFIGPIPF